MSFTIKNVFPIIPTENRTLGSTKTKKDPLMIVLHVISSWMSQCKKDKHFFPFPRTCKRASIWSKMIQIIQFYSILSNFTVKKRQALFHFLAWVNMLHFDPILSILIQNDPILSNFTVQKKQALIQFPCTDKRASLLYNFIQFYPFWSKIIQFYPISQCKRGRH